MKAVKTLGELRREFRNINSVAAGSDRWLCKAFMFLIDQGFGQAKPKPKRRATEWNRYFAKGMKAHKSPAQIAQEWKARRETR